VLARLAGDARGLAATEFALTLPFVLLFLPGATEITNLVLVDRKLVAATQTTADLVTQETQVTSGDLSDIFRAAELVMQPYDEADLRIGIANVRFDPDDGTPTLDWQAQRRAGSVVNPLAAARDLGAAGESVIVVSLAHRYRPVLGTLFIDSFELTESAFSRPRRSASVIANEDSGVAVLPGSEFRGFLMQHGDLALKYLERFANIVRGLDNRVTDMSVLQPDKRVYNQLLRLSRLRENTADEWVIEELPSHREIASWTSTTREVVAYVIGSLSRRNIIERKQKTLYVRDVRALRAMAG